MNIFSRWLVTALALWITAQLGVGLSFESSGIFAVLFTSLILGFVNVLVKPIMVILTLPFTIVTFGLFLLVVNAIAIAIVATLSPLAVSGFWGAIFGAVVLSIINSILTSFFSKNNSED